MRLTIRDMPENKLVYRLLEQWPDRLDAIAEVMPQIVARLAVEEIKSMAPRGIQGYPDMLGVYELPPEKGWKTAVIAPPPAVFYQRIPASEYARTILYVEPKIVAGVSDESAVVLSRENPWTPNTLPFEPSKNIAKVISRQVKSLEVERREAELKKVLPAVKAELKELGVAIRQKPQPVKRKVIRDYAFEIIRHEFSVPPVSGKAHWRPALRKIPGQFAPIAFRKLYDWFADPTNRDWKSSAGSAPPARGSVVKRIQRFQEMVMPRSV